MLEIIALKLITSLTGFLFEGYLDTFKYSKIDGAPSWYGNSGNSSQLVGYGYYKGGIETIYLAQNECKHDIENKITKGIEISIYDNFKFIKDSKEKEFLSRVQYDAELKIFIDKNVKYERIEHFLETKETLFKDRRKHDETFAGCMISKDTILFYQKERMAKIRKDLLDFKAKRGQDELDSELENNGK